MGSSIFNEVSAGISETDCEGLSDHVPPSADKGQQTQQIPPLDLSVTHALALLDEEDKPADIEANFSPGMLSAFHSKISELASLLKEDSPGLNLNAALQLQPCGPCLPQVNLLNMPQSTYQVRHMQVAPPRNWPTHKPAFPVPGHQPQKLESTPPFAFSLKVSDEELKNISVMTMPHVDNKIIHKGDDRKGNALKAHKEAYKIRARPKAEERYVDLNHLLLRCANAIGSNDRKEVMDALVKVKQHVCQDGNGSQRMAYYFADALEARLQGTGWQVYRGQMRQQERASAKQIFKAIWMYMLGSPFAKAFRYLVNQMILDIAKKASVLHIMEYQFTGILYPSLFKALAERPGGPPQVRLIAGYSPHYSMASNRMEPLLNVMEHTGRQLKTCAECFGVPFHFTPWVGETGTFNMSDYVDPNRGPEEVLAILSVNPLRHINDDLLSPPQKRLQTLQAVRSMNPEAFIRGFVTASYSTPFFSRRFREALYHFESQYDQLDTFIDRDNPDRLVFESEILGRAILNLVACEEVQVVEKAEKYNQCYASIKRVGLEQVPFNEELKFKTQKMLSSFHKNYIIGEDLNYLLMGWKGRMLYAMAVWKAPRC